jgi:hypothetical protein
MNNLVRDVSCRHAQDAQDFLYPWAGLVEHKTLICGHVRQVHKNSKLEEARESCLGVQLARPMHKIFIAIALLPSSMAIDNLICGAIIRHN